MTAFVESTFCEQGWTGWTADSYLTQSILWIQSPQVVEFDKEFQRFEIEFV